MTTKICTHCNIEQDITLFANKRNVCKSCRNKQYVLCRQRKSELIDYNDITKTKKCIVCYEEHNILQYSRDKNRKDGYYNICKKCDSIKRKEEYQERKNRVVDIILTHKICHTCKINKTISKFKQTLNSKDGYFQICTDCRPNNWTKEKQRESEKKYVNNNREKFREKWKKQGQNINRRIRDSLNHRISEMLLKIGHSKKNKTVDYIQCDKEFLKKWFEYLFEEGMNWENYGEWHIDHVIPCSSFNLSNEEDQKKCFSWKNLRPCWAKENIIKGGKILPEVIESHNKQVNEFINSTTKLT